MLSLHETIRSWRTRPALLLSRSFFPFSFFFLISGFHAKPFLTTSLIPLMDIRASRATDDFIILLVKSGMYSTSIISIYLLSPMCVCIYIDRSLRSASTHTA